MTMKYRKTTLLEHEVSMHACMHHQNSEKLTKKQKTTEKKEQSGKVLIYPLFKCRNATALVVETRIEAT